jgi:hypothetical protein
MRLMVVGAADDTARVVDMIVVSRIGLAMPWSSTCFGSNFDFGSRCAAQDPLLRLPPAIFGVESLCLPLGYARLRLGIKMLGRQERARTKGAQRSFGIRDEPGRRERGADAMRRSGRGGECEVSGQIAMVKSRRERFRARNWRPDSAMGFARLSQAPDRGK